MVAAEVTPSLTERPPALVRGEAFYELPDDLYIPPDALEVFLEAFEGPLDLLLYLIKKQGLDILDIPVAEITRQYMDYVELMGTIKLSLAAEYLVMAAMLMEIKSRLLLPRQEEEASDDEHDPRAELVRRLQEYERFKTAAERMNHLPRLERDHYLGTVIPPDLKGEKPLPTVELRGLLMAMQAVMKRAALNESHAVKREPLSLRERMTHILGRVQQQTTRDKFCDFHEFFTPEEGRAGVVVSFIAILELLKQSLIEIIQQEPYSPIHIRMTQR
ncbi:MAG: segregation and condensation protein A [Gammaproteobacteria bacterium]